MAADDRPDGGGREAEEPGLVAGVELGGTKCVCILGSGPGDVAERVRVPTTTPDETLDAIERVLDDWTANHPVEALGIASFGPLDLDGRSQRFGFITATTKPGWRGTDVARRLERRYRLPTAIDTDVVGAALAEGRWGAARGLSTYAYVTIGTGVGAGLIVNGLPIRGLGHPEVGHIRVARMPGDTWAGACAFHGDCVEGLASGPAIAARTGSKADELAPDDPRWEQVAHAIAGLCHNLLLTVAPQAVLIGGGVMSGQPHLFDRIRPLLLESLNNYGDMARIGAALSTVVAAPALGDEAGPLGSIAIGSDALRDAFRATPEVGGRRATIVV
jgi:fructokinase